MADADAVATLGGRALEGFNGAFPAVPQLLQNHVNMAAQALTPKLEALMQVKGRGGV
jgi:hypothetical protein